MPSGSTPARGAVGGDAMLIGDGTRTDQSARLQEATREFAGRYERHAYLVFNLALRITCEPALASAAAERAFLEHTGKHADEDVLAGSVVHAALGSARRRPQPAGAGGTDEERMLAAVATLAPPERAAVAMVSLQGAGPHELARVLGVDEPAADRLLTSGFDGLAAALATTAAQAHAACDDWLWAAPPQALWEAMYPKFYRAAEHRLQAPAEQPTQVLPVATPRRRLRLPSRRFALALAVAAVVAGTAIALPQLRGGGTPERPPTYAEVQSEATPPPAPAPAFVPSSPEPAEGADEDERTASSKRRKPLTPAELDQLRRRELRMLELYTKRETDRRLSATERGFAAKQVSMLRDLARRRADADRRERELRRAERRNARRERELARERRRALARDRERSSEPRAERAPAPAPAPEEPAPEERNEAQDCLYNPDDGTYICQE